jgi:hypothetical protein
LDTAGYEYDSYVPRPAGSAPFGPTAPITASLHASSQRASGPVALQAKPVTVQLAAPQKESGGKTTPLLANVGPDKVLYLRLENVTAAADPAIAFDVFLNRDQPGGGSRNEPAFVGSLTFFGVGHAGGKHVAGKGRTFSFVVNETLRRILAGSERTPQVTVVPTSDFEMAAKPTIGRIALVSA